MEMHHSPRTVPESSRRSVMFVEKMDSDRTGLVASCNWLIGLVCKDEKRLNLTTLGDLHRIHLAHHGPSVPIQLGPTDTNNFSDLWWPRPTHGHHYPSRPSEITRHAGPDTLVVANHHGFHPITVSKIPPGWSIETFEWNNVQKISLEWDCTLTE